MSFGGVAGSSLGLGFQTSSGSASSNAWQDSARKFSGSNFQNLRDKIMQGASAVRSQRSTVVQSVNQGEQMGVQTEVIANHNHCHAITMEYFEVLRHFAVEQKLMDVQECLFVPMEMTPFTYQKILRWKEELSKAISNPYLKEGFGALERIKSKYMVQGVGSVQQLADERIKEMFGTVSLSININRPADIIDQANPDGQLNGLAWQLISRLTGPFTHSRVFSMFHQQVQAERDRIFREEILPEILANFIENLEFGFVDADGFEHPIQFDATVLDSELNSNRFAGLNGRNAKWTKIRQALRNHQEGSPLNLHLRYVPTGGSAASGLKRSDIVQFYIKNPFELPEGSNVNFVNGRVQYRSASLDEVLFSKSGYYDDITSTDSVYFLTELNERETHKPVLDDFEKANSLIDYLNDNIEYYHKVIWYQMDADKRFMMLDGFVAPNSGGKSVASVVENKLLGVVGNNLVMPVSRGVHLDPTFAQDDENPVNLLNHYRPTTPIPPFRVSVPTRGVYAESVMGSCNSCEEIDESRFWRFTEVPSGDEPTAIQPISTDSRRTDPGDLTAQSLPQSIVNFQNVPEAPAPAGLTEAIKLLSTPGIFSDLSGLSENQKNALQALLANQKGAIEAMSMNVEAAQNYANMAKELVQQEQMLRNADKLLKNVNDQKKKGNLSDDDVKELTKDIFNKQIGNGKSIEGGNSGSKSDSKGGEGSSTSIKDMLPENPSQFGSYEASEGEEGTSVKYTTNSEGGEESQIESGEESQPLSAAYEKPKDIIYAKSWKKSANVYRSVFDELLQETNLPDLLGNYYHSDSYMLEMKFENIAESNLGTMANGHEGSLAVTNTIDFNPGYKQQYGTNLEFLLEAKVDIYANPDKVTVGGKTVNNLGRALVLLHECAHASALSHYPVSRLNPAPPENGEQVLLDYRQNIEDCLLQYASFKGISLSGVQESFTGTSGTWQTEKSRLLSFYGLFVTRPQSNRFSGLEFVNEYSIAAYGEDLLNNGTVNDAAKFDARLQELQGRIFELIRD